MRILAIRGRNLASLYGPFELVLSEGPIAATGLFSVSGPTGAGKSTLLDALCLALYGRTPRLRDAGGVPVGRADELAELRVASNDARGLLSRGAASGGAEVDFEGVDGRRYRAAWSVHRARKRPGGKLQQQTMALRDLATGEPIGQGLSGAQAEIERRVGFTFEEFRRAVVLPQFEFKAFLDARADDRAAILERVTGTDVYSRLSVAAHERGAAERRRIEALEQRAAAVLVLPDEERSRLEERLRSAREELVRARADAKVAADALAWHALAAQLASDELAARAALSTAQRRGDEAEPLRRELLEVEAAQPARPAHDEALRCDRACREAEGGAARTAAALAQAAAGREAARAAAAAAGETAAAAKARAAESRPKLEQARRADQALEAARQRSGEADAQLDRARADAAHAQADAARLERDLVAARAELGACDDWLRERGEQAPLAAEWPRWKSALQRHASAVRDLAATEERRAAAAADAARAGGRREEAAGEERRAADRAASAQQAAAEAATAASELDLVALRRDREALGAGRDALLGLARLAEQAAAARAAGAAAGADAEAARGEEEAARAERERWAAELLQAEARRDAAREALQRLQAALGLAERRHELRRGEPCPLCGATEHPYSSHAPAESAARAQAQAAALEDAACKAAARQLAAADERRAVAAERAQAAARERRRRADELSTAAEHYAAALVASGQADLPENPEEAVRAVAERLARLDAAGARARAGEDAALARADAARRAREASDAARDALEGVRRALGAAERAAAELDARAARLAEDARRLSLERDGVEAELEPAFTGRAGWRDDARSDARAFLGACERVAAAHAARRDARARAAQQLEALQPSLEAARAVREERRARAEDAERSAAAARTDMQGLAEDRASLLGGRRTAEVEAELLRSEESAGRALEGARAELALADRAHAAAEAAAQAARVTLARALEEQASADAALAQALARLGADRAALAQRLARDPLWIRGRRAELDELRLAVERGAAALDERRRRAEEHAKAGPPALDPEEAPARLADAEGREAAASGAAMEAQVALRQDDDNRGARAAAGAALDAQRAAAGRWTRLAEAIGSADGKKFRTYAQSLAFEALVASANAHLRELARRYRLQRVPGTDLDLQIADQDLGGEVRSVNSLSGGESFLVSLALALGLASLSTRATQSRTLFIDEGFGTLDRDALEHAMVALEGLRSTGRTVGVVSHVPELHERIGVQVRVEPVGVGRSRVLAPVAR